MKQQNQKLVDIEIKDSSRLSIYTTILQISIMGILTKAYFLIIYWLMSVIKKISPKSSLMMETKTSPKIRFFGFLGGPAAGSGLNQRLRPFWRRTPWGFTQEWLAAERLSKGWWRWVIGDDGMLFPSPRSLIVFRKKHKKNMFFFFKFSNSYCQTSQNIPMSFFWGNVL